MSTPDTLRLKEFATHLGCAPSYVTKLKQAGRLVLDDAGRVKVAESQALIEASRDPSKRAVADRHTEERGAALAAPAAELGDTEAPHIANPDYQAARAKREHYAALQAEADYRAKIRELLDAGKVRAVLADVLTELRTQVEAIPHTLAPALAAMTDEAAVKAALVAEIESALHTASARLEKLGRGED